MDDGTALIELRRRKGPSLWAVIDAEDYERVCVHRWHANIQPHTTYALGRAYQDGSFVRLPLHRFIVDAAPGAIVDHRDGNGLNNRRDNLRVADVSGNRANSRKTAKTTTSRYKGVSWCQSTNKWRVSVAAEFLGRYATEEEAALVYDAGARLRFGASACLNFPESAARPAA